MHACTKKETKHGKGNIEQHEQPTSLLFSSFNTGKSISSVLERGQPSLSKANVHNVKKITVPRIALWLASNFTHMMANTLTLQIYNRRLLVRMSHSNEIASSLGNFQAMRRIQGRDNVAVYKHKVEALTTSPVIRVHTICPINTKCVLLLCCCFAMIVGETRAVPGTISLNRTIE